MTEEEGAELFEIHVDCPARFNDGRQAEVITPNTSKSIKID